MSDIRDCVEDILQRYGQKAVNPSIRIYTNKIENRITFKIKTGVFMNS